MEGHGISYLHLLSVVIRPPCWRVLVMSFLVTMLFNSKLSDDRFIASVWKRAFG